MSAQAEIHSVGWPFPLIIGLPGGVVMFLWIFDNSKESQYRRKVYSRFYSLPM